ncbi:RNA-binding domain-containing protein [Ceratobasidium sp. AG-I]|nr:RNA-binding domain-containing protein [Ceratobasidium sp. AG-I]
MAANPASTADALMIPVPDPEPEASTSKAPPAPSRSEDQRGTRLYVGNLDHSVDEYALLQVFSKFGNVIKLDFLFHKSGPLKGKPRGYAFLEYATKQEATKALVACHDKPLRRRRITVTFASQSAHPESHSVFGGSGPGAHRRYAAAPRHTTLSLLKTHNKPSSTSAKIAALEAKLGVMERDRTAQEEAAADALLTEVLGPNPAQPKPGLPPSSASLPVKPPTSIVPAASTTGAQSVPRAIRPSSILSIPKSTGPALNLGMPITLKNAVARPPALAAQDKDKLGKAAMQASLGIVRKK